MMGINGYQYIEDSVDCMICADDCTSSTCDDGPRVLPWSQDYDDGLNCQEENIDLLEKVLTLVDKEYIDLTNQNELMDFDGAVLMNSSNQYSTLTL